jgi:flagellar biosynthesis chaperone FliJ
MKPFHFSLERVLTWRATQLSLAEVRMEHLRAALISVEQAVEAILVRRLAAQTQVGKSAEVQGSALAALEALRLWTLRESQRLKTHATDLRRAVEEQNRVVTEARRQVRLVERLKERRYEAWKADSARAVEEMAGEFAVAQWRRTHEQ